MRVLVIGGTQFIGRATTKALLDEGHEVTTLNRGRTPNPFAGAVKHITGIDRRKCPGRLLAALREGGPWDVVVDFVAFEPSDLEPIIDAGSSCIRLYVLISTDSVYMAVDPAGFVRASASHGLVEASDASGAAHPGRAAEDEYGAGKLSAEVALRAAAAGGDGLVSLALRLPDVIGSHENTGRQQKLMLRLLKGRRVGTAISGAVPSSSVSLVAAADVGRAVCAVCAVAACGGAESLRQAIIARRGLQVQVADREGDISTHAVQPLAAMNICADEALTWSAVVQAYATALRHEGLEVPAVRFDSQRDTSFLSVDCGHLDNSCARAVLDGRWQPAPIEARVREAVAWWVASMRTGFEKEHLETSWTAAEPAAGEAMAGATSDLHAHEHVHGHVDDVGTAAAAAAEQEQQQRQRQQPSAETVDEVLRERRLRRDAAREQRAAEPREEGFGPSNASASWRLGDTFAEE
jgi:nucleoside-diphosphate-sugar epimerase